MDSALQEIVVYQTLSSVLRIRPCSACCVLHFGLSFQREARLACCTEQTLLRSKLPRRLALSASAVIVM